MIAYYYGVLLERVATMASVSHTGLFSETYQEISEACAYPPAAREEAEPIPEAALQRVWQAQLFTTTLLNTVEGQRLEVLSPGWWNKQAGPDFQGAQLRFNGQLLNGDVEVHLEGAAWRAHGHHADSRYNGVILHVVLNHGPSTPPAVTLRGRKVATLHLTPILAADAFSRAAEPWTGDYSRETLANPGRCAAIWAARGAAGLTRFLDLAGEWRMLNKARRFQERAEQVGAEQALHEEFIAACGYSQFKRQFREAARALPYERARQLALQDPLLLEAALMQISGLLPDPPPSDPPAALQRLLKLRETALSDLRALPLEWRPQGVRPNNRP